MCVVRQIHGTAFVNQPVQKGPPSGAVPTTRQAPSPVIPCQLPMITTLRPMITNNYP